MITHLDDNVGRLLAWLERSGQAQNTMVVFLSDHGEMGGSHGLRNKQVPYEESLRIPLIFRPPGWRAQAVATTSDLAICGVDIAPTTLGMCGIGPLPEAQGTDLSATVIGHAAANQRDAVLIQWNDTRFAFGDHPYRAIRTTRHKLVSARDEEFRLLFDLDQDPYELDNLYDSGEHAELRRALEQRLSTMLQDLGEPLPDYLGTGPTTPPSKR